jgi:hypothetical protein
MKWSPSFLSDWSQIVPRRRIPVIYGNRTLMAG